MENFLYEDIYPEGLENRVHIANEKLNAYYEEMDKQREVEEYEGK